MITFSSTPDRTDLARRIHALSVAEWGEKRAAVLVGRHAALSSALEQCVRCAAAESPVLITGETGTGKELFARTLFLTQTHRRKSFLTINCAQYGAGDIVASELFGHRKGSFTGAVSDRKGLFEEANGGTIVLDEIAELPLTAQAMLLRTLSEGEVIPVGESRARRVDVRIIAATNRELEPLVEEGTFRRDLYYRLRYLHVHIPPVRERGDDWELIARHWLNGLADRMGVSKEFSDDALAQLSAHDWPGNVREVKSVVETGFHMSDGALIGPANVTGAMSCTCSSESSGGTAALVAQCLDRMMSGKGDFWSTVHKPFMARDMNREEARAVVAAGLRLAHESYVRMLPDFGVEECDYLKFMDFLRHNRLKPAR